MASREDESVTIRPDRIFRVKIAETLATARIQPVPWPWEFLDDRSSPAGRHPCRESGLYLSRGSGCPAYSQGQTSSRRQQMKFGTTFGRFDRNLWWHRLCSKEICDDPSPARDHSPHFGPRPGALLGCGAGT